MAGTKPKKALLRTALTRVFLYQGIEMPDPDPTAEPRDVRDLYASAGRPELGTAEVRGPEQVGNTLQYSFHLKVGTKGYQAAADIDDEELDDEIDGPYSGDAKMAKSQIPLMNLEPDPRVVEAIGQFQFGNLKFDKAVNASVTRLTQKGETARGIISLPSSMTHWFF